MIDNTATCLLFLVAAAPCLHCIQLGIQQRLHNDPRFDLRIDKASGDLHNGPDCIEDLNKLAWFNKTASDHTLELEVKNCVDQNEINDALLDAIDMKQLREATGTYNTSDCVKILLPSIVYLGQGHSASTSFAIQLDSHPNLSYGLTKEHHWGEMLFSGNGYLNEYAEQFQVPCSTSVSLDFSPGEYLDGHHGSFWMEWRRKQWLPWVEKVKDVDARVDPKVMKNILGPAAKLIVMLRDPVDFLASLPYWWMDRVLQVDGDCYANGVERWLNEFPRENILFIRMEQYVEEPQMVLDNVFKFVGVSPFTSGSAPQSGRRRSTDPIESSKRREYHSYPRNIKCKQRLEQLTGMKFTWREAPEAPDVSDSNNSILNNSQG